MMTCQCSLSSAISVVIWFPAISSFTRSRHLSFGLPRFQSTTNCNIILVASSLSRLCTCPNHLKLFYLRNSAIGYMCASFQMLSCYHFSHDILLPFLLPNTTLSNFLALDSLLAISIICLLGMCTPASPQTPTLHFYWLGMY